MQSQLVVNAQRESQRSSTTATNPHFLPTNVSAGRRGEEFLPDRHLCTDRSGLLIPKLYLLVLLKRDEHVFNLLRIRTDGRPCIADDWQLRATGSCAG